YCIYIQVTVQYVEPITKATNVMILVGNGIYVVTAWVSAIAKRDSCIDFWLKLIDFDTKLQTMGIRINYKKRQRKILIHLLSRYFFITANIFALLWMSLEDAGSNLIVDSMAYFLIIINSAICHQTGEIVSMIKMRFVILNTQLQKMIDFLRKN